MLVCRRKCCTQVDVLRIRVGCSTTRTPLRIARLIVLTTAVTTPRTTPLCAGGCSGRSAPDERENFYIVEKSFASLQGQSDKHFSDMRQKTYMSVSLPFTSRRGDIPATQ